MSSQPELLALDFDGVLCDGLQEYFQTAWQAHCQLWSPDQHEPPAGIAELFYRLRPIVETGWEMPVIIHALRSGFSESEILNDWSNIAVELLTHDAISPQSVATLVDQIRDHQIQQHLPTWLKRHRFYPGVIERLKTVENFVIISTKEGRFIQQLLAEVGIELKSGQLFGKEQQRPKPTILRELRQQYQSIWFVEDRLKTLEQVILQPDLNSVQLFLADWGYNLPQERDRAALFDRIQVIGLYDFTGSLEQWQLAQA